MERTEDKDRKIHAEGWKKRWSENRGWMTDREMIKTYFKKEYEGLMD
jgi:hypothetical protein